MRHVATVLCALLAACGSCSGRGTSRDLRPLRTTAPIRIRGGVVYPGDSGPKPNKQRAPPEDSVYQGARKGVRDTLDVLERDSRLGFVRKVYAILSAQLFVTFGTVLYFSTHKSQVIPLILSPGGKAAAMASMVAAFFCPLLFQMRPSLQEKKPTNFILLSVFTLAESLLVGMISLMYSTSSVLLVLGQTAVATLALSIYAFQPNPRFDMNQFGNMLYSALMCMISLGFLRFLNISFEGLELVYSGLCAILFSGFIVFDTKRLVSGDHPQYQLKRSQYIMGSMALYMDIVGLFLHLLRIFGEED